VFYAAGLLFGSGRMWREGAGLGFDAAHLGSKIHGNSYDSTKLTRLYKLNDSGGRFRKWGMTSEYPIAGRYAKNYLADNMMDDTGTVGSRREVAGVERWFEEYLPGPDNRAPWSGRHRWDFPSLFGQ